MKSFSASGRLPRTRRCVLLAILGNSEKFWLGLQGDYDLEEANKKMGALLNQISAIA